MYLLVTATDLEMRPLIRRLAGLPGWQPLVTGIGCLETAVRLGRFLEREAGRFRAIVNCGVAGALVGAGPQMLDICLAEDETLAELGVWTEEGVVDFDRIEVARHFPLDAELRGRAQGLLAAQGRATFSGPFVTLLAVSGRELRGERLRRRHGAICENMEGAAVARLAQEFGLPCLELRTVSNMVVDRDPSAWRLAAAVERCAEAMAIVLPGLLEG